VKHLKLLNDVSSSNDVNRVELPDKADTSAFFENPRFPALMVTKDEAVLECVVI
jgi:hypothetical protein